MTQLQGYLTAKEVGVSLGVSDSRIRQLIKSIKVGLRLIKEAAIELVRERKNGRPAKSKVD